jgi:hypothetical protein
MEMNETTYCISSIEFISFGVYRVTFAQPDRAEIDTLARVSVDDDSGAQLINFDSDEVGKASMKEFLDIRGACAAISAFHKAQRIPTL